MKAKKTNPLESKSRYKRKIAITVALLGAAAVCIGLLRLSPKAYRPQQAVNPEEVSPYLTHQLGPRFFNHVQLYEPFEMVIEQDGVNDILSRGLWPQRFGEVTVWTPTVLFERGRVYAMSRVEYRGLSSIVTIAARPFLDDRNLLNMDIQWVRLGLLPVTGLARRIAGETVDDYAVLLRDWPDVEANLRAIIANEAFDASFLFDKQRIGVQGVGIEPGQLRVRLVPENKAVYKY